VKGAGRGVLAHGLPEDAEGRREGFLSKARRRQQQPLTGVETQPLDDSLDSFASSAGLAGAGLSVAEGRSPLAELSTLAEIFIEQNFGPHIEQK